MIHLVGLFSCFFLWSLKVEKIDMLISNACYHLTDCHWNRVVSSPLEPWLFSQLHLHVGYLASSSVIVCETTDLPLMAWCISQAWSNWIMLALCMLLCSMEIERCERKPEWENTVHVAVLNIVMLMYYMCAGCICTAGTLCMQEAGTRLIDCSGL